MKIAQKLRDRAAKIRPFRMKGQPWRATYDFEMADIRGLLEEAADKIDGLTRLTTELTRRLMEKSRDAA